MTPAELMKAILQAPVDLLWNGGIGTYVKAAERDPRRRRRQGQRRDPGQRPRAARQVRRRGRQPRASPSSAASSTPWSGPSGTAAGSTPTSSTTPPGVDTSDHEVNIKILLDRVVKDGDLTEKQRNKLLAEMTDEVGELVLRDNYEQNLALANAAAHAPSLLHVHEDWMRRLEREGVLNRELEGLPTTPAGTPPPRARRGPHHAGAVGAAGLDQDRAGRRAARPPTCPTTPTSPSTCGPTSRR